MKKFISWNVNGLRACVTKGFLDYFKEANADVFCIQPSVNSVWAFSFFVSASMGFGSRTIRARSFAMSIGRAIQQPRP